MPVSPAAPLINGNRYDFSSIVIRINGKKYSGIQAIDYAATVDPAFVYGQNTAVPIGRTRGQLKTDSSSIEILREDFGDMLVDIGSLAVGLCEANFIVTISFSEVLALSTPQIDTLIGCRFKGFSQSAKQGSDPLAVKLEMTFMNLLVNGVPLVNATAISLGG